MAKKEDTPTPVLGDSSKSRTEAGDPKLIEDRYKVLAVLGQGGMGKVFLALDTLLSRKVAVKVLPFDTKSDELYVRFHREARAASKLNHPGIITTLDFGVTEDGKPYLVMEYIEGVTLDQYLSEQGPLDFDSFTELFSAVTESMANAHAEGVIHRDLKPSNIIIGSGEHESRVMILDFGIAKIVHDSNEQFATKTGQMIGSPKCISPEQIEGGKVDERSDIYSIGCVMYEALTGVAPFSGRTVLDTLDKHLNDPVPDIVSKVSDPQLTVLAPIVSKAMAKDPGDRFQSMEEVLGAINDIAESVRSDDISGDEERKVSTLSDTIIESEVLEGGQRKSFATVFVTATTILMLSALFYLGVSFALNLQVSTEPESSGYGKEKIEKPDDAFTKINILEEGKVSSERAFKGIIFGNSHAWFVACPNSELVTKTKLKLNNTPISDDDLVRLPRCEKLQELKLGYTQVSTIVLDYIAQTLSLKYVHLERTINIDHSQLDRLKSLPNLIKLDVGDNNLTNSDLKSIAKLSHLKNLIIDNNPKISDEGLRNLVPLKELKVLILSNTGVTPKGLALFKGRNMTIFVEGCPQFKDVDFQKLSRRLKLKISNNLSGSNDVELLMDAR